MTNLEKLETAIRSALPELMGLTEGCELKYSSSLGTYYYKVLKDGGDTVDIIEKGKFVSNIKKRSVLQSFTIIGHPVTIIHLLRWLGREETVILYPNGALQFNPTNPFTMHVIPLDLSKPNLSHQSDEVIDELVKLVEG